MSTQTPSPNWTSILENQYKKNENHIDKGLFTVWVGSSTLPKLQEMCLRSLSWQVIKLSCTAI